MSKEAVITGIGLVSSLGEGIEAHWEAFTDPATPTPRLDTQRFTPFPIHFLPEIDWSTQIPRRGDLRQMDNWQRLGVHAAGLALADAGMKDDESACATMDMTVAAAGGARDLAVDEAILTEESPDDSFPVRLNRVLSSDLRPTLFLAQLSNLLAGNISIVHKVTGSSRTFMGEEGAGISAIEHAVARIRAGQSTHALVGAAYCCEGADFLLALELSGLLHEGDWQPVWERGSAPGGGVVLGSGAAFFVIEERSRAEERGVGIHGRIEAVVSGRAKRDSGYSGEIGRMLRGATQGRPAELIISGASGADAPTAAEREALEALGTPFRSLSTMTGHLKEAQLPFAVALAALAVSRGKAPARLSPGETHMGETVHSALATCVGMIHGEGAALISGARGNRN